MLEESVELTIGVSYSKPRTDELVLGGLIGAIDLGRVSEELFRVVVCTEVVIADTSIEE